MAKGCKHEYTLVDGKQRCKFCGVGKKGGRRAGAGAKKKERLPVPEADKGMSARILKQIEEEQKIIDILAAAYEGDKKFWWEIVKELRHEARGKPVQTLNHQHDKPLQVDMNINLGQRLAAARKRMLGS